jgi:hypothetical protein
LGPWSSLRNLRKSRGVFIRDEAKT